MLVFLLIALDPKPSLRLKKPRKMFKLVLDIIRQTFRSVKPTAETFFSQQTFYLLNNPELSIPDPVPQQVPHLPRSIQQSLMQMLAHTSLPIHISEYSISIPFLLFLNQSGY